MWLWCFDFCASGVGGGVDFPADARRRGSASSPRAGSLDLAEQIFELGVRLALDRHAADVADIAVIVAAGVDRHDVALLPASGRKARG